MNLGDFCVSCGSCTNLTVAWMLHVTAHVSGDDIVNTSELFEDRFDTPEAACAKGGDREWFFRHVLKIGFDLEQANALD
jgi:hypothetical protein